jgi:hypothetical protein
MRDIRNIQQNQNHFLAGTWVLKALAGGAKQVVGKTPI